MAEPVQHFRDLFVWQRSMELVTAVYELTARFPTDERFGLTSQLRRASVSVPSNIAEGQARRGTVEFTRFLSIAAGSLAEVQTQLQIAVNLRLIRTEDTAEPDRLIDECQRMIRRLKERLAARR